MYNVEIEPPPGRLALLQDEANYPWQFLPAGMRRALHALILRVSLFFRVRVTARFSYIVVTIAASTTGRAISFAVLARTYYHLRTQPTLIFAGFSLGILFHAVFPTRDYVKVCRVWNVSMELFHPPFISTRIPGKCMKLHCASRGAISLSTGVVTLARFCCELLHFTLHVLHAFLQDEANHIILGSFYLPDVR
jgi:hypothetical protein